MAEAHDKPSMNWTMQNLDKEWKRFKHHSQFTFAGPLAQKTEKQKVNNLMTYIGDKGMEMYSKFTFNAAVDGTLDGAYGKYDTYCKVLINHQFLKTFPKTITIKLCHIKCRGRTPI